jgi:hypothetical protein
MDSSKELKQNVGFKFEISQNLKLDDTKKYISSILFEAFDYIIISFPTKLTEKEAISALEDYLSQPPDLQWYDIADRFVDQSFESYIEDFPTKGSSIRNFYLENIDITNEQLCLITGT